MPDIDEMNRRIAGEIRAEMARRNVKQTQLARDVFGTYAQKIQSRVSGHVAFTTAETLAIADYLGVDVVKFLNASKDGGGGNGGVTLTQPYLAALPPNSRRLPAEQRHLTLVRDVA